MEVKANIKSDKGKRKNINNKLNDHKKKKPHTKLTK